MSSNTPSQEQQAPPTGPKGSIRVVVEDVVETGDIIRNVEEGEEQPEEDRNALLEHVEQPEEDPNNLRAKDYESESEGGPLKKHLNDDIYALMYVTRLYGTAFWFAILVFIIQATILGLIFSDLVDMTSDPPMTPGGSTNRLKIPAGTEPTVKIAQFCGVFLVISFMASGGDLLKGLSSLFNGYDPEVAKVKEGATHFKWVLAGVLQALVGLFMTADLFILMMQSTTVIGMCLNFAALHFVQDIDDVAFTVGSLGLIDGRIKRECLGVGDIRVAVKSGTTWMRRAVMLVMFVGLYAFYFVIAVGQANGEYRCSSLYIQFGDHYFPELPYYSGRFENNGSSFHSSRDVFYDESGTVKLRYSRAEKAWLIQFNDGEDPDYMIKSSETEGFDPTEVGTSTWFANTDGGDLPAEHFTLVCGDCTKSACNPDFGTCIDNVCICEDNRLGYFCEGDEPKCGWMGLDLRTKDAVANIPGGSFFINNEFQEMGSALQANISVAFFDRQIYLPYEYGIAADRETIRHWIAFTGRRWVIFGAATSRANDLNFTDFVDFLIETQFNNATPPEGLEVLALQNGYRPLFFSTPVDFGTTSFGFDPLGVEWVFAQKIEPNPLAPDLIFGWGPNDGDPVPAQFLCSDCLESKNCMNNGTCSDEWGYCECLPFYSGYQCEFIHSCNEMGCFNGGTCNELTRGCEHCIPEASGTLCQYPLPPKIDENRYFCKVVNGYAGPCLNHQTCNGIDMTCECEEPFYGEFCELSTQANCSEIGVYNVSDPDPCQNGGYCDWRTHWPICRCRSPYQGDFCQFDPSQNTTGGR